MADLPFPVFMALFLAGSVLLGLVVYVPLRWLAVRRARSLGRKLFPHDPRRQEDVQALVLAFGDGGALLARAYRRWVIRRGRPPGDRDAAS